MKPFVSIIVPMYNVEAYIEECVNSLLRQTLRNIEIILVDDGSPDRSGDIARRYCDQDARVKVIHKKNGGLSSARNAGLHAATGEYVGFVDGDDFVSPAMFENMYAAAKEDDLDIVMCGYHKHSDKGNEYVPPSLPAGRLLLGWDIKHELRRAHETRFIWYVWRNLYRRDLLKHNELYFYEDIRFAEDSPFNLYAFYAAKRVKAIDEGYYMYRCNPESLTELPFKPYMDDSLIRQYRAKKRFYETFQMFEECSEDLQTYMCKHQIPMLLANACAEPKPSKQVRRHIKDILSYRMVQSSVEKTSLRNKKLLLGQRIVLLLCKLHVPILLELFFKRNLPSKG
ncbi:MULTISPECIES: glycosyltransferase [Bacillus]|uniref:Glycosyltransferase n=1 Tax=Bacillus glycinifermentans TaxID=1664069 RepID=A0AAJ4D4H5_9BACI|nr:MULTISPECIES: glycosyltransferase [Bacillus]KKB73526.1 glycosyltransferase [Bacillus sp. TH008]MBU8785628.1 glycosyltransferase [Bacillus glycinifermentans]MDU0073139.1 glycosyltransferase [Bacillus sp. IG6]MED8020977.1 glycosyltransferase [Bacillus glycinifermentans]NUJ15948.1 glycosyltransferase [Bacillus glycinifermentans]